jgi:hypothetical protein
MQVLIPLYSLSKYTDGSSYVATQARKKMQAARGIIPQDTDNFGSIKVIWIQDADNKNIYRMEWKSKLTNSVTNLSKLGNSKFLVSRVSPTTDANNFMFQDKEPAVAAFFYNTDLFRTNDANANAARRWCAQHLKRAEGIKSIKFNPRKHKNTQSMFDRIVTIGEDQKQKARIVGIDFSGRNVHVKIYNENTKKYDIHTTLTSDQVWLD